MSRGQSSQSMSETVRAPGAFGLGRALHTRQALHGAGDFAFREERALSLKHD